MNITPNKVLVGKDKDGSKIKFEEYDYDVYAGMSTAGGFVILFFSIFLGILISPIIFIMNVLHFKSSRFNPRYLVNALVSGYVLLDFYKGWLMSVVLDLFIDVEGFNLIAWVNVGIMVVTLMLYFFGHIIHEACMEVEPVFMRWVWFIIFIIAVFYFSYSKVGSTLESKGDWHTRNIDYLPTGYDAIN